MEAADRAHLRDKFRPDLVKYPLDRHLSVVRDPYKYILTDPELFVAYSFHTKLLMGTMLGGLWALYHLRR